MMALTNYMPTHSVADLGPVQFIHLPSVLLKSILNPRIFKGATSALVDYVWKDSNNPLYLSRRLHGWADDDIEHTHPTAHKCHAITPLMPGVGRRSGKWTG